MIVIDRKAPWIVELAWLVAFLAELGHERAAIIIITREYLHSMIVAIDDEQEASMMVEHQAHRQTELAISIALLLGADRELDSSITIKRIVSHLFHFNLSHTQRQQEEILQASKQVRIDAHETPTQPSNEATTIDRRRNQEQYLANSPCRQRGTIGYDGFLSTQTSDGYGTTEVARSSYGIAYGRPSSCERLTSSIVIGGAEAQEFDPAPSAA